MNTEVVIKANNISKKYDESYALDSIDLEVSKGQIMGLIGPNGAGKSTFLQSVLGLLKTCLLYTSPSPRDATLSRMPSSA